MKVAFVCYVAIPSRIADSVHAMKMSEAFVRRGHDVVLYALPGQNIDGDPFQVYGCKRCFQLEGVHRIRMRGVSGWHYASQIVRSAERSLKPDLYYTRHVYALAQAACSRASLLYEAHEPPSNAVQRRVLNVVFRMAKFRRLVVISEALRREYTALFPNLTHSGDRVIVAHDAADPPTTPSLHMPPSLLGRPEAFSVGYVGALYVGKGMEMITAIAGLLPEMDFHIVGGEETEIISWRERIRAPNVIFYGYRPHSETSGLIAQFDAVLLPLQHRVCSLPGGRGDIARWTSPNKLFEYMAHGKPIVASELPVLQEVIERERNALIAASDDPLEWVCALRRLAAEPGLRRRLGDSARADLEAAYTWDKRAERVLKGLEGADGIQG